MKTQKSNYRKKKNILKKISKIESGQDDQEEDNLYGEDWSEQENLNDENDEIEVEEVEEDVDEEVEEESEEEVEAEEVEEKPASEMRKKGKKPTDKEKFYVDPKQFDDEIVVYYDTGNMSNELALMVSKIAHKLSYAPNFINYTFREEMVGDGVIRMFKALMSKKYDREKGTNPFSYFTRIAFNAFRNRIKKEKHMRDTHEKYQNELMLFSENYNTLVRNNQLKVLKERLDK
jgi:hypothetical protein